jgi:hypothetical protein
MNLKEIDNEELVEELLMNVSPYKAETEILFRLKEGENLKCCGNCRWNRTACSKLYGGICKDNWEPDGMTRKEREIK